MTKEELMMKIKRVGDRIDREREDKRRSVLEKFENAASRLEGKRDMIAEAYELLSELNGRRIVPLVDYTSGLKIPKWTTDGVNHRYGFSFRRGYEGWYAERIFTLFGREGGGYAGSNVFYDISDGLWKTSQDGRPMDMHELALWATTPHLCTNYCPTWLSVIENMAPEAERVHAEIVDFCENL